MNHAARERGDGGSGGRSTALGRTAAFVLGGLGALALGLAVQPRFKPAAVEPAEARLLFPELADPEKAASMEIVTFDDETATLRPFKVVQAGGVWKLPSHDGYPADAKEQLAAACNELVDRPILNVVSTSPADHEMYEVIEPDPEKLKVGTTGVGKLVDIRDASGNKLARLVIGKEAKRPATASVSARPLRYVRKAGQDPVYLVDLDAAKFTTKFDDWIEKDLLKLSPWEVRRLVLDDATCALGLDEASGKPAVSQSRKSRIELGYDDQEAKWSLESLEVFDAANKPRQEKLAADEELASGKLNDLRNALGDLKIIDVARKPAGLSGDLKAAAAFTDDREAVLSLAQRGFFPFASGEILSSNGETVVGMKDGVEYLLRFGNGTSVAGEAKEAADRDGKAATPEADKAAGEATGRYLLVMARFDESLLEKPKLEPLPEVPAVPAAEEKKDEKKDGEKPAADAKADASGQLAAADEAEAKAQAALEERRRVERENRRKQDAYDDTVKAAQKRVKELNARFADWYYVVSDAEYAKIHLGRAGAIQEKAKEQQPEAGAKP